MADTLCAIPKRVAISLMVGLGLVSAAYAQAPSVSDKLALYASVGPELTHYELDAVAATLTKRSSVTLPQDVQYAWPHQSRRVLYVAWSDGVDGHDHGVTAFSVDSASGTLRRHGEPARLPARPIHLTVDMTGTHNRANGTREFQGKRVLAGGENTIAVYAIDQDTGEPTRIQNIDTRGMRPRTFALDPAGRVLVAANQEPFLVREGELVKAVPASLAVFRVGADGKLDFVRKYDVAASESRNMLWMGMVPVR